MKKAVISPPALLCFSAILCLTGCLDVEEQRVHCDIDLGLSADVRIEFIGVHSDEKSPEAQKKEVGKLYGTNHLDMAQELALMYGLEGHTVTFTNKTDLRCDATLAGKSDSVLRVLTPLTQGAEFEFVRNSNIFSARIIVPEKKPEDKQKVTLLISYEGRIVTNNAAVYDKEKRLMTWQVDKLTKSGIRFVLSLRNE